jgi:hypothetical protein
MGTENVRGEIQLEIAASAITQEKRIPKKKTEKKA